MPKGKAVGAGGMSVEVLIAAGPEAWQAFYDALKHDIRGKRVARTWRRVLYVLLRKKPPNRPEIVSENREIALMPQGLKLFMQMVRVAAYNKVLDRIHHAQCGWLAGLGPGDPALSLAHVVQQARRLCRSLFALVGRGPLPFRFTRRDRTRHRA